MIGADGKASAAPVTVRLIQEGIAVIEGVAAGTRVVVEGAQNIRPGSVVSEAQDNGTRAADKTPAPSGKAD